VETARGWTLQRLEPKSQFRPLNSSWRRLNVPSVSRLWSLLCSTVGMVILFVDSVTLESQNVDSVQVTLRLGGTIRLSLFWLWLTPSVGMHFAQRPSELINWESIWRLVSIGKASSFNFQCNTYLYLIYSFISRPCPFSPISTHYKYIRYFIFCSNSDPSHASSIVLSNVLVSQSTLKTMPSIWWKFIRTVARRPRGQNFTGLISPILLKVSESDATKLESFLLQSRLPMIRDLFKYMLSFYF
jgi:hypothetical protein